MQRRNLADDRVPVTEESILVDKGFEADITIEAPNPMKEETEKKVSKRAGEGLVRGDVPSTQAVVKGPQEERVGVAQDRSPHSAAPPSHHVALPPVTGVRVADAQKPPSKPRRKPPLQAKPSSRTESNQPDEVTSHHPRPQTLPRASLSRLPNGHTRKPVVAATGAGTPGSQPGTTIKKSPSSPKVSPRTIRKRVVSSSADHQNNQSSSSSRHKGPPTIPVSHRSNVRSSSSQPTGYPPIPSQPNGHSPGSSQPSDPPISHTASHAPREGQISKQQEESEQLEVQLLGKLNIKAHSNDYYRMLGVEPGCSQDDLAKARREKSRELHPDHCANDEQQRIR